MARAMVREPSLRVRRCMPGTRPAHDIEGLRKPDAVAHGLVPGVAGGGEVAEVNLTRLPVVFEVGADNHRSGERHPREAVAYDQGKFNRAVGGGLNHDTLIHETVIETGIPRKHERAADNGLAAVPLHDAGRHVKGKLHPVTGLPSTGNPCILSSGERAETDSERIGAADYPCLRVAAPFRNAQGDREVCGL